MANFTSWLVSSLIVVSSHVWGYFVVKEIKTLDAPQVAIVYELNQYHPVVAFNSDGSEATFEIEYITPVGRTPFRTIETQCHYDVAYASPCYVRVRYRSAGAVSKWSKTILAEPQHQTTCSAEYLR